MDTTLAMLENGADASVFAARLRQDLGVIGMRERCL